MTFPKKIVCESMERSTYAAAAAAPLFHKSFFIAGNADQAEILICGLGFYDLYKTSHYIEEHIFWEHCVMKYRATIII